MILTKRLTEKQKDDIVESFKFGMDIDALAQKNSCTSSTIIRNLKKNLGELKYKELINRRKSSKGKSKSIKNQNIDLLETNSENKDSKNDSSDTNFFNENITSSNFVPNDYFFDFY